MEPDINIIENSVFIIITMHRIWNTEFQLLSLNLSQDKYIEISNIVLNEWGPDWTSLTWYFHSSAYSEKV